MSLYRETGRRSRAAAIGVVAVLAIGLAAGYVTGRATAPSPSLAEQVRDVQDRSRTVIRGFELVRTHYPRDRAAGRAQARRAEESFADVRGDLVVLDPIRASEAANAVEEAVRATERNASPKVVDDAAGRAIDVVLAAALLGD